MQQAKTPSISSRIGSAMIDHACNTALMILFSLPLMVNFIFKIANESSSDVKPVEIEGPFLYLAIFGLSIFFIKDLFNAQSIGKRLCQLQVIDHKTGNVASPLQCFVRNITTVFIVIEFIFLMINPSRRLGDYIAGTRVESANPPQDSPYSFAQLLLPLTLAYALSYTAILPYKYIFDKISEREHIEESYNEEASHAIQLLLMDVMPDNSEMTVRVYNKEKKLDVPYVKVSFQYPGKPTEEEMETLLTNINANLKEHYQDQTYTLEVGYTYQTRNGRYSKKKIFRDRSVTEQETQIRTF